MTTLNWLYLEFKSWIDSTMHFLSCLQAHLEIQVPTYYAGNDPLLTYATPLHPQEEHTTSREELIGKVHSESTGQQSLRNSVDS